MTHDKDKGSKGLFWAGLPSAGWESGILHEVKGKKSLDSSVPNI